MKMRGKYINLIDKFIYDFGKAFNSPYQKGNKHTFSNEDKNLSMQVEELRNKQQEIQKIFTNIANFSAQKRINYIDHIKKNMKKIEK